MSVEAREHTHLERWLETNKMKFKKVLYLEGGKKCTSSGLGKPDLIAVHGKQT